MHHRPVAGPRPAGRRGQDRLARRAAGSARPRHGGGHDGHPLRQRGVRAPDAGLPAGEAQVHLGGRGRRRTGLLIIIISSSSSSSSGNSSSSSSSIMVIIVISSSSSN